MSDINGVSILMRPSFLPRAPDLDSSELEPCEHRMWQ
jgi:hypothetical protein